MEYWQQGQKNLRTVEPEKNRGITGTGPVKLVIVAYVPSPETPSITAAEDGNTHLQRKEHRVKLPFTGAIDHWGESGSVADSRNHFKPARPGSHDQSWHVYSFPATMTDCELL
ncbi:hypothetical protein EYF80_044639 [Liparis tanakae]|uniref:Uncharacterized protein n=1 Tax=Liparis tanakae TaxID=230148 RepID=A0A4Z2FWJ5_9TELE|nr:hypothetical protein EYF80_044639 [Liparis tanakae]